MQDEYFSSSYVSKVLNIGPRKFMKRLRDLKLLNWENLPVKRAPQYFKVVSSEHGCKTCYATRYSHLFIQRIRPHIADLQKEDKLPMVERL